MSCNQSDKVPDVDLHYLQLLSRQYPNIQDAATEAINLAAVMNLPKGTEHFLSDLHGEYEAFLHVLKNGSGVIAEKINILFGDALSEELKHELATLIYYPEEKLSMMAHQHTDLDLWYREMLGYMIKICRLVASKYTRSKVRKALPDKYAYIIEELLNEHEYDENKQAYYASIIESILFTGRTDSFIIAIAELIQRLAIDRLHIIGDIYDRGPGAHIIMDRLMAYHTVDIQWGNHDIMWMGAAAGSKACMANAVRISLRYANTGTLSDGYGISLLPLATFAMEQYGDDPCARFQIRSAESKLSDSEYQLMARMHKAISIIQFKLEAEVIKRRPHYNMEDRLLLDKINFEQGTVCVDGRDYAMQDMKLPTVDPAAPYALTEAEQKVVDKLVLSFASSEKLHQHIRFLFSKGSMYLIRNNNLLYHGCVSMNPDGSFRKFYVCDDAYSGKAFMDRVERLARQGYFSRELTDAKQYGQDAMWYLWSGSMSPLFGKARMATFERYFLNEKETHVEQKDCYYTFRNSAEFCKRILEEFGLDPEKSHIINGHVPVKVKKGESPIKADGKLIVIDGGLSKAYQKETGIAGYTLIYSSHGIRLVSHHPFVSRQRAVEDNLDIHSTTVILETSDRRLRIKDTDTGQLFSMKMNELHQLLAAYRNGQIIINWPIKTQRE